MTIFVLRVINSSRHINCFVRGYIDSLFASLVRVFRKATREYNPVRRTFYDENYM